MSQKTSPRQSLGKRYYGSMRTPTLYPDTPVPGGYFDDESKQPARELWRQMEGGRAIGAGMGY